MARTRETVYLVRTADGVWTRICDTEATADAYLRTLEAQQLGATTVVRVVLTDAVAVAGLRTAVAEA
ncbi:MAG TPA: hypothetical protein VH439_17220 [Gemmatimonadales bacterium]|jgi:hypothetical protein